VAVEPAPALLGGVGQLVGLGSAAFLEPALFATRVRSLTVAMLLSIAFEFVGVAAGSSRGRRSLVRYAALGASNCGPLLLLDRSGNRPLSPP
jgi:hypothetical protein